MYKEDDQLISTTRLVEGDNVQDQIGLLQQAASMMVGVAVEVYPNETDDDREVAVTEHLQTLASRPQHRAFADEKKPTLVDLKTEAERALLGGAVLVRLTYVHGPREEPRKTINDFGALLTRLHRGTDKNGKNE